MKIPVKHAKYTMHGEFVTNGQRRKLNREQELTTGYTMCGVSLYGNNVRAWRACKPKSVHLATCARTVTCKRCLRAHDMRVRMGALSKPK